MSIPKPDSLLRLSVDEFLSKTAAKTPTPGGGTLAGLTACLAIALARMVVAYSSSKAGNPEEEQQVFDLSKQLVRLDGICRRLIDEDAAAYEGFADASRKVRRQQVAPAALQEAVRMAISVPLELLAMSVSLLRMLDQHKAIMNPTLHSDLAVVAHLAKAACQAANETVQINVFELDSADDRTHIYSLCDHFLETSNMLAKQILSFVHR